MDLPTTSCRSTPELITSKTTWEENGLFKTVDSRKLLRYNQIKNTKPNIFSFESNDSICSLDDEMQDLPKNTQSSDRTKYSEEWHSLRSSDFSSRAPVNSSVNSTESSAFTWAFFNCPTTLKIAGLLLLAGGLCTLTAGVILASATLATVGAVISGVGALLGIFGYFNAPAPLLDQSEKKEEEERSLYTPAGIEI